MGCIEERVVAQHLRRAPGAVGFLDTGSVVELEAADLAALATPMRTTIEIPGYNATSRSILSPTR